MLLYIKRRLHPFGVACRLDAYLNGNETMRGPFRELNESDHTDEIR